MADGDHRRVARVGDMGEGICYLHQSPVEVTVTLLEGIPRFTANGREICCVGSRGIASCGHETVATTGSGVSGILGRAIHRIGDQGIIGGDERSIYYVVTGSDTVGCA